MWTKVKEQLSIEQVTIKNVSKLFYKKIFCLKYLDNQIYPKIGNL